MALSNYLVQVWELLMADQTFFIGELPPAQQARHLLPVGQLVLPVISIHALLWLTVAAVGCHQPHLWRSKGRWTNELTRLDNLTCFVVVRCIWHLWWGALFFCCFGRLCYKPLQCPCLLMCKEKHRMNYDKTTIIIRECNVSSTIPSSRRVWNQHQLPPPPSSPPDWWAGSCPWSFLSVCSDSWPSAPCPSQSDAQRWRDF